CHVHESPSLIVPTESSPSSEPLRSIDRDLLKVMRGGELFGVGDLTEALAVTATAIRQRLERLLESGLIEREKVVAGRGRPTYRYRITDQGKRHTGADATALAEAMWVEVMSLEDAALREQMLTSIASRLGKEYAAQMDPDAPLADRMRLLSELLATKRVATDVKADGELPVLDINSCPYPTLADASTDYWMCRLEERVLSEALGKPVQLSRCCLDGDSCCQFTPSETESNT
ncbi:MAG: ArsR family transcriptional regulator, partial [Planctomycetota bacterium]